VWGTLVALALLASALAHDMAHALSSAVGEGAVAVQFVREHLKEK
jgi:hypothetical protein